MARLCRFYVSGAGNESARFNQLLVDLRDRHEWNPQNTIIIEEKSRDHRRLTGSARGYRILGKRKKVEETREKYNSAVETEKEARLCIE